MTWEMNPVVQVWDPVTGRKIADLPHDDRIETASFGREPNLMLTCARDLKVRAWDVRLGRLAAPPMPHPRSAMVARFTPDGERVESGGDDGIFRVWDWRRGRLVRARKLSDGLLLDFAMTPDRRWLAAAGPNWTVLVDAATGAPVAPPLLGFGTINLRVTIPPDGRRAIVSGFGAEVVGHDLAALLTPADGRADELIARAELLAGERVLENLEMVQLAPSEWAERWRRWGDEPGDAPPDTDPEWHRARFASHAEAGRWTAALWHLDRLIALRPDDMALYAERGRIRLRLGHREAALKDLDRVVAAGTAPARIRIERGTIHARAGRWKAAAEDYARAAALEPEHPMTRYFLGLALLAGGDREGYREACSSAMERFGQEDDLGAVDRLGYTCVAGPAALADPSRLVRLLEAARLQGKVHPRLLAAARYRAGQPGKALEAFEESRKTFASLTWDRLFLALVHHSLGHADEARRHLAAATKWIDDHDRDLGGSVWPDWWFWVECHGLRREAEDLIR
jgi:tetratricopeptide (TPR) repeat protein